MRMGQGVRTDLEHGGITCVLQTQFSSFFLSYSPTILQRYFRVLSVNITLPYLDFYNVLQVGWFGFNGPLRQYFGLYQAVSQREGESGEKG